MKSPAQKQKMDKGHEQDVAQPADQKEQQGKEAPKGALKAADEKTAKDQKEKGQVGKAEVEQEGVMTTQEAEKMLQAIRDQEMLRRLRRQAAERNQHIPVDRDW
jgi:Ca-activated chloride channel family protein